MEEPTRAGEYRQVREGYRAYMPGPLPPDPPLRLGPDTWQALARADRALGRLEAVAAGSPVPEAARGWLRRREAVASARLDGVPVRLVDLVGLPAPEQAGARGLVARRRQKAARGVVEPPAAAALLVEEATVEQCRRARRASPGIAVLREVQGLLGTPEVRRGDGWRREEIWIGPRGSTIHTARFVPPPPRWVPQAMQQVDEYLGQPAEHAPLVRAALVYHQIDSIHPFDEATGRANRVLAAALVAASGMESASLLGLARFFLRDPGRYLSRLQAVREGGDWGAWIGYFLEGLEWSASDVVDDLQRLCEVWEHDRSTVAEQLPGSREPAEMLLDFLPEQLVVSVSEVAARVDRTFANANQLVARLEKVGVLKEITGQQRNRRYRYEPFWRIVRR